MKILLQNQHVIPESRVVMSTNPYLKETWHTGVIVQTTAVAKKAIKRMLRPKTIGTMVKARIVQNQAISPGSRRTKTNNLTLIQKNIGPVVSNLNNTNSIIILSFRF